MAIDFISSLRSITLASTLMLGTMQATATELVRPRPLTEYADILLAQELERTTTALNGRIAQCVEHGQGDASECLCRHPAEALAAKMSYEKVLQARPKWRGKRLYWKNMDSMASDNLIMPAIDHQLAAANTCDASSPQQ